MMQCHPKPPGFGQGGQFGGFNGPFGQQGQVGNTRPNFGFGQGFGQQQQQQPSGQFDMFQCMQNAANGV